MPGREPITESHLGELLDLDLRSTADLVELINDEDARVAPAVRAAAAPLAAAIDDIVGRLASGGRLIYVGAGSSGRAALADAAECGPTFGIPPGQVIAVVAGGPAALAEAREEGEDDAGAGAADLAAAGVEAADAVVVLSASGSTPYALGAARAARSAGALLVCVCCAEDSELGRLGDHEIVVLAGPEVIAGSTRMKSGTAQKLVLNTISTVAMVRLGKTFGNLMVGVVPANAKLRARARRTVGLATGAAEDEVAAALDAADGDVKVAIVSILAGVDPAGARARLDAAGGAVRGALAP
jgi:N-acetylmuramic acid 6-phosphate etherase